MTANEKKILMLMAKLLPQAHFCDDDSFDMMNLNIAVNDEINKMEEEKRNANKQNTSEETNPSSSTKPSA